MGTKLMTCGPRPLMSIAISVAALGVLAVPAGSQSPEAIVALITGDANGLPAVTTRWFRG